MPRKTTRSKVTAGSIREPELMPFQIKHGEFSKFPINGFSSIGTLGPLSSIQKAKATLPIFGGTSVETKSESSSSENSTSASDSSKTKANDNAGGGDSSTQITPEEFERLTRQVTELTTKNTELATTLQSYQTKEDEARRSSQNREESLTEDLTKAQETIDAMDQIIKRLAVINAIQGNPNIQFHNPDDAIARLDHSSYQLDVDLENRTATVSGIENELSRIAKENSYLIKKPTIEQENTRRVPRSTGTPPGPTPTNASKAERRKILEAKWPVIASGRAAIG